MATYRIELKPVETFFFGGEITFGNFQNYLVKSNFFPQQTTLLGMVRKRLLDQYGLIDENGRILQIDKNVDAATAGQDIARNLETLGFPRANGSAGSAQDAVSGLLK